MAGLGFVFSEVEAIVGVDCSQVDRLFRQSGLMRDEWGEVRYADGSTYGEEPLKRADSTVTEYYDPDDAYPTHRPASR